MPYSTKKKRKKSKGMDELELLTIIARRRENGVNMDEDELSVRREKLLERYMGSPYGNERRGQSKVVTRQCLEAVEWTLPSLMRVFLGSPKIAEFDPIGPEDEEQAKQETLAVNRAALKNDGFMTLMMWIKDCLMNQNAYVKVYWDERVCGKKETYENATIQELEQYSNDENIEILAVEETSVQVPSPYGPNFPPLDLPTFTIEMKVYETVGKVVIESVPQEELSVDGKLRGVSLEKADYVSQRTRKTRTELIEMGFDEDLVYSLPTYNEYTSEEMHRREVIEGSSMPYSEYETNDESTEFIEVDETYLWVDYDGDGVAEFRQVISVGDTEILENSEADSLPFVALCSVPLPHSHVGLAWMELVEDLQEINTTLARQTLNNLYRANNPRPIIGPGVNMDDVLNDIPNYPIRADNPENVTLEPTRAIIDQTLPAFQWLREMGEDRTGVSRTTKGLDADALERVAKGAFMASLDQANQRIEALAMIIAECGFKPVMLKIHELIKKHRDTAYHIKEGNNWAFVDPREWKERNDMTILVGLGAGNKQAQVFGLDKVFERQAQLRSTKSRIISEQNEYEASAKLVEIVGLHNPDTYFTNPQTLGPPPPPQPDPLAQAQAKLADAEMLKAQSKAQNDQAEMQRKYEEMQLKYQEKIAGLQAKLREVELKLVGEEEDRELQELKILLETEIKQQSLGLESVKEINNLQMRRMGNERAIA